MIDQSLVVRAAEVLHLANEYREPCPPVRDILDTSTDIDIAYAVQETNTARSLEDGRRLSGRKIGLTSKAVQAQLGVDQPDFGPLFVDMEEGDGVEIDCARLLQPRAEAEVALVLAHDLDKGAHSFAEIISATAYALPAIEIVDSRVAGWDITIVDSIADNASSGLYVLGGRPIPLRKIDLRAITMSMTVDGDVVSTGSGAACLGHPLNAARWLADKMCERGTPLRAGDVVMTGALGPMHNIAAGNTVVANLGALGTITTIISSDAH